jgi:hypothetical protein
MKIWSEECNIVQSRGRQGSDGVVSDLRPMRSYNGPLAYERGSVRRGQRSAVSFS